jgi:hypothetical protein
MRPACESAGCKNHALTRLQLCRSASLSWLEIIPLLAPQLPRSDRYYAASGRKTAMRIFHGYACRRSLLANRDFT